MQIFAILKTLSLIIQVKSYNLRERVKNYKLLTGKLAIHT